MSNYKPRNYRIISIRQQKRILHVEDALDLDRIRFELWDYAKGNGAKAHADAYLEVHTARALAAELATGRLQVTDGLQDSGGGQANGQVIARLFSIENADTDNPIRITITNGPGVKQDNGLISLRKGGDHTRIQILINRLDAKRIGWALLQYIQAWEFHVHVDRRNEAIYHPELAASEARQTNSPPGDVCDACKTSPCICDRLEQNGSSPEASESPNPDPDTGEIPGDPTLRYGNDEPVSDNKSEIQAYQAYLTAEKRIPESVEALRQWVRDTPNK